MSKTSYISSVFDYEQDKIMVWERPIHGGDRILKLYPAPRYFYVPDENGEFTTITDKKVKKVQFDSKEEFDAAKKQYREKYESDFQPEARLLMDEYYGRETPVINYAFLDIETDYSSKIGWSAPENPYAPINAITIYQSWTKEYLSYVVPPKNWKYDAAKFKTEIEKVCDSVGITFKPNFTVCANERDLLLHMLGDIENADIISGWNSEFFDNPYIIKRLERVLGKRGPLGMCFKGAKAPKDRIVNRFGSPALTYALSGRTHLDYLDLFKKFTFEGRISYSLANIAAEELDTPKLEYPGTLEQLYKGTHIPNVEGITWETSEQEKEIDTLNIRRELLKKEIERRGLKCSVCT
jgi:DNA polymerase elongation subunit (family B)